jgi:hypothetical protein
MNKKASAPGLRTLKRQTVAKIIDEAIMNVGDDDRRATRSLNWSNITYESCNKNFVYRPMSGHVLILLLLQIPFKFTLVVGMHPMLQSPAGMPRRRGMATSLRIEPPAQIQQIALALGSDGSDSDYPSPQIKPPRNMKKLSLLLPSAQSSFTSLQSPLDSAATISPRPSLPTVNPTTSILLRKDEDGSPSVPYIDGPVQIIPGIWIGSEDNACDWKGLVERGIRSILNVAKEVTSPFDSQPFNATDPTYYPPLPTGRPAMYYLQLQWSHGQQNLVNDGFQAGMAFADAARNRGDGCLIQYVFYILYRYQFHSNPRLP